MKTNFKLFLFIFSGFLLSVAGGVLGAAASDRLSAIFNVGQGAAGAKAMVFDSGNGSSNAKVASTANTNVTLGTGGTTRLAVASDGATVTGQYFGSGGGASAPLYSFTSDGNTGLYSGAPDDVGIAAGGSSLFAGNGTTVDMNATSFNFNGTGGLRVNTAAVPAYTFIGDTNTGMYQAGADTIGFQTGGVAHTTMSSLGISTDDGASGSYIRWKIFTGSLTASANTSLSVSPGTVVGAFGYSQDGGSGVNSVIPSHATTGACTASTSICFTNLASTTAVKITNFDSGNTNDYTVVVFYH